MSKTNKKKYKNHKNQKKIQDPVQHRVSSFISKFTLDRADYSSWQDHQQ